MRQMTIALVFFVAWFLAVPTSSAQKPDDREHAELAKRMKDAKISLTIPGLVESFVVLPK